MDCEDDEDGQEADARPDDEAEDAGSEKGHQHRADGQASNQADTGTCAISVVTVS